MSCCSVPSLRDQVREGYAIIAKGGNAAESIVGSDRQHQSSGCCAPSTAPDQLAAQIGYADEDLEQLPEGANLGLSCGNPGAIASLKPGETVVDLGSGGGFDCFICGPKVGASGRVIGVDMTHEMLGKARSNTSVYTERTGLDNVEFRLGEIEHLPVANDSADVIISNCVINLSTQKEQVWREIQRVLKSGGRACASDIALVEALPEGVLDLVENWIGCVAGAVLIDTYREHIQKAGLVVASITPKPDYVKSLMDAEDPFYQQIMERLPAGKTPADYITSVDVLAYNGCVPNSGCC